ncbi:MAG: nucleotidyltransferase [Proteobacteria bacterium]|nr:nucleotidyltransferase [Pseudomonadota bacterium]
MTDLNRLLQVLRNAEIEFVIVGGFAAMLHGSALLTRDLDVCALLTPENVDKLRHVLREFHPIHRMTPQRLPFLGNPEPGVSLHNLYLQTDLGPLDILSSITGVGDYGRVLETSIEIDLFGERVRVISIDELLKSKEALGREKDRLAAKELRAIIQKGRP